MRTVILLFVCNLMCMLPMLAHSHPIYNEHKDSIQNELVSKFLLDVENENYQQAYQRGETIFDQCEDDINNLIHRLIKYVFYPFHLHVLKGFLVCLKLKYFHLQK